ncbi:DUF3176 domain-containing protein [Aspergillus mulundensis]|uniref:Uncharacterized protein n=1 Tax=Aspergillus mulundensis TaxID=1810919 RepID=A0A3D8SJZ5_9EURO|nr:Uncharacterized protein DSM5745_02740 [Aspergillus mulundensis]RDW86098.1 Uncharacterized protein DSM5745_02740 [Aspergillus mulundensis]
MAARTEGPAPTQELLEDDRRMSEDQSSDIQVTTSSVSTVHETASERSARMRISDWFVLEILATGVSAGALIALVAVLAKYDGKPQPDWYYMSLNSLISWLSTISRACILFFVSEALGQSKWVWFSQEEQPISNIRTFDSATRGPYGALELIWTLQGRHFAALGSLAVVLALAFDPFAQNLVHYYEGTVRDTSNTATISSSSYYGSHGGPFQVDAFPVEYALKTNVYNVFFSRDSETPWSIPRYGCPSTNCTWDSIVSLDARALCANITEHLTQSCDGLSSDDINCTATLTKSQIDAWALPYDPDSEYAQAVGFVVKAVNSSQAITYTNTTTSAIQFVEPLKSSGSSPGDPVIKWEATECTIEPVVRKFRASVRNNDYSEETLAIWSDRALVRMNYTEDPDYLGTSPDFAFTNDTDYQWHFYPPWSEELTHLKLRPNQSFIYTLSAEKAIAKFLRIIFTGYYWQNSTEYGYNSTDPEAALYASSDVLQSFHREGRSACDSRRCDVKLDRFNRTMSSVAQAIAKTFRDSQDTTYGHLEVTVTHIAVHWQWITLPIFVWVLGAVALFGTVWKTRRRRAPRWKNDPLPLLFLYQDGGEKEGDWERPRPRPIPDIDTVKVKLHGVSPHL